MALSLAVYLFVRLYHIASYPIYFFTDEAVQTVLAADFVQAGFRDFLGHYFPTYFQNVYEFNLNLSVYAQVLPYLLFGKSVIVTRATAALLTLPGAAAVGLSLRDVFRARYPWIGVLLLSSAPAWFLHSRSAFETALMVSFYACFLYCYLLYRTRSPHYLYPALIFAAAVFYTYGPGEIIILGTGILLLASDARYHWQQRGTIARGLLLGLLLALPYIRFRLQMPEKHAEFLRLLDSIWLTDAPFSQKLTTSLGYYAFGLSPKYWFFTNTHDMGRHVMGTYANLMTWTLPFVLGGIAIALRRIRQPEYRAVLACVLAIPLGGVVVGAGITRLLSMVIPASLLAALALDAAADWLARRVWPRVVGPVVFLGLSLVSFGLLRDALVKGPLWSRNYGMDIPWGATQVFGAVKELIQEEPDVHVFVSPTWANGVDTLARFFLPDGAPVDIANADRFTQQKQELTDNMVLVLTASEYEAARADPKLTDVRSERLITYPDGSPGFYFVRMRYSPVADALVEQEELERQQPITETVEVGGHTLTVEHPFLDSGTIQHMFDGDTYTLARGYEANPLILRITFDAPRPIHQLVVTTGSMDFSLTVHLYPVGGAEPKVYLHDYLDLPDDPTVTLAFDQPPEQVARMDIEITQLGVVGPSKLHIREIELK
jgi:4-amino-4-deoxy-L-arabinose transferase-like glycosyltransferase